MTDREVLITEGRATLCSLFDFAVTKLAERGITLTFSPAVVEWMARHAEWYGTVWFEVLNPLRTLDGVWQAQVGQPIMDSILRGVLTSGRAVRVDMSSACPAEITFEIVTGNSTHPSS